MNQLTQKQAMAVHILIFTILYLIPMQWGFYLLVAFYLIGIPKSFKDEQLKQELTIQAKKSHGAWWEILGVQPDATLEECQRVRKLLSKIYHPDGGEAPNEEHMARINMAFEERAMLPDLTEEQEQLSNVH